MKKENKAQSKNNLDGKSILIRLAQMLEEDIRSGEPKYPSVALPALHDDRVQEALVTAIDGGAHISAIADVGYEDLLGQSYVLFAISKKITEQPRTGLLVVTDFESKVISIKEDFDTTNNAKLPTAPKRSNVPFAFTQDIGTARSAMLESVTASGSSTRHLVPPTTTFPVDPQVDFPGFRIPTSFQRVPFEVGFDGKNTTECTINNSTYSFTWWHNLVQDDTQSTLEQDDCGDQSLFNADLQFGF